MGETSFAQKRKIVAITMVKNEMDIIESFVRHTLGFADLLIVADHKSTDRTRDILEALRAEGLPIIIEDVTAARYVQAETMTRLLWEAADVHHADLIVPLDADEFLVPMGETPVRDVLERLQFEDVRALRWRRYAPAADDGIPAGTFALSVPLVCAKNLETGQKIVVNGELVRKEHIRLVEGNHLIIRKTETKEWSYCGDVCDGLELAHLPWRSPAQSRSKFAVGWINIAGKYSKNTPSGGGYRDLSARIRKGETPRKDEGIDTWEACNLQGRVPFPVLRYSNDTVPDVLANVMAAGEALAEELAETRALTKHPLVTTVVPYLGGGQTSSANEMFRKSLRSALGETYPWHEILIPVFGGVIPRTVVQDALEQGARLLLPENLCSEAKGEYVEWILPGETVRQEKLREMVTCAESQDWPHPLLLSDAEEDYPNAFPLINFKVKTMENCQIVPCASAWQWFLLHGKYPSRGLSGVLVRKGVFDACGGLMEDFAGGKPHLLRMWRTLLQASAKQPYTMMLVLHENYTGTAASLSLKDVVMHQMDWHALCIEDQALLGEEQVAIFDFQRQVGKVLLKQAADYGVDLQVGIWPAYRQMLATLERERVSIK